jgi:hypothetical protein
MPEYVRVRCEDTGHESSIAASAAGHGNYILLDEDAVNPVTGDLLPPLYASPAEPELEEDDPDEDDFLDD